jgi:hypothetical protein
MATKNFSAAQLIAFATGAFLGGLFCSWLSSPRSGAQNRQWLSESTHDFRDKLRCSGKDLRSKNLPDLYEATEDLGLTDEDLLPETR